MNLEELMPLIFDDKKPKKDPKPYAGWCKYTLTYNGKTMSVRKWAEEIGVSYQTVKSRIDRGYTIDKILYPGDLNALRKKKQDKSKHPWGQ